MCDGPLGKRELPTARSTHGEDGIPHLDFRRPDDPGRIPPDPCRIENADVPAAVFLGYGGGDTVFSAADPEADVPLHDVAVGRDPALGDQHAAAGSDLHPPGVQNLQHHHRIPDVAENLFGRESPGVNRRDGKKDQGADPSRNGHLSCHLQPLPASIMALLFPDPKIGGLSEGSHIPRQANFIASSLISTTAFTRSAECESAQRRFHNKRKGRAASADPASPLPQ